jgi:hypothetical protein
MACNNNSSVFIALIICLFQWGEVNAQSDGVVQSYKALELAAEKWQRYTVWDGPDQRRVKLTWTLDGGQREDQRIVHGAYYLRSYSVQADGKKRSFIAIRNPEYATYLESLAGEWKLLDIAYPSEDTYQKYSREAEAPWLAPFFLPGQGSIVELIRTGSIALSEAVAIKEQRQTYRFSFSQGTSIKRPLSALEIDASPELDWFPQRLHWGRGTNLNTLIASDFVNMDGYFIPTRMESISASAEKTSTVIQELVMSQNSSFQTKECYLAHYGLDEIQIPKNPNSRRDWLVLLVPAVIISVVVVVALKRVFKGNDAER